MNLKSYLFLFVSLFIICSCNCASGQCIDSNLVNPDYICNDDFNPQCGCDGKLYYRECAAHYQGGNLYYVTLADGNCANYAYEINPTLATDGIIIFDLFLKNKASVYILIYDIYGREKYEENLGFVLPPKFLDHTIPLSGFDIGMYFIAVLIDGEVQIKKFVKSNKL